MAREREILTLLHSIEGRISVMEERLDAKEGGMVGIGRAAEILGTTKAAVYRRIDRGQVPCVKVGSRLRFDAGVLKEINNRMS